MTCGRSCRCLAAAPGCRPHRPVLPGPTTGCRPGRDRSRRCQLVTAGKVRHLGLCEVDGDQFRRVLRSTDRRCAERVLAVEPGRRGHHTDHGGTGDRPRPFAPLGQGFSAGEVDRVAGGERFPSRPSPFQGDTPTTNQRHRREGAARMAAQMGISSAHSRWPGCRHAVGTSGISVVPIPGTSGPTACPENVAATDVVRWTTWCGAARSDSRTRSPEVDTVALQITDPYQPRCDDHATGGRRPRAGPRDDSTRELRVLDAAADCCWRAESRHARWRRSASRCGVSKPSIYRRWPQRTALAIDAFAARVDRQVPLLDTGNAPEDLVQAVARIAEQYQKRDGAVFAELIAAAVLEPGTPELLNTRFFAPRRAALHALWAGGVSRGQLVPDADAELMIDLTCSGPRPFACCSTTNRSMCAQPSPWPARRCADSRLLTRPTDDQGTFMLPITDTPQKDLARAGADAGDLALLQLRPTGMDRGQRAAVRTVPGCRYGRARSRRGP